jgi:hypothetical protein
MQESTEKSIEIHNSERLDEILWQLSPEQVRFVAARQDFLTDKETAEKIGISPSTVYNWSNREAVKEAVQLMALDGLVAAKHMRRRSLTKAMRVKVDGLDSGDERLKQNVATEIIEWEMGKAEQPIGGEVSVNLSEWRQGAGQRLADALAKLDG